MGLDYVGLGSNLYGMEFAPQWLVHIGKTLVLTRRLMERGHPGDAILKFLGGNHLRIFEQVWG